MAAEAVVAVAVVAVMAVAVVMTVDLGFDSEYACTFRKGRGAGIPHRSGVLNS